MGILSTLKNVFLPSAQTAADRREAVFGTTSKVPAIVAAAAAAAIVAVPVLRNAAIKVVATNPVTTLLGGAVVAGGGLKLVEPALKLTKKATETTVGVIVDDKPLTSESFKDVAKVVGIAAGAGLLGTAVGYVGSKVLGDETATEKVTETVTPLVPSAQTGTILPATTSVSTGTRRYKRRTAQKTPSVIQSVRVNVINRPVSTGIRVSSTKYIKERLYN